MRSPNIGPVHTSSAGDEPRGVGRGIVTREQAAAALVEQRPAIAVR